MRHHRIHKDQSNLIPLDPEAFVQTALTLLASDRYLQKGMAFMALTGRRPAEIFFSAKFSLPRKKLHFRARSLWTNPGNLGYIRSAYGTCLPQVKTQKPDPRHLPRPNPSAINSLNLMPPLRPGDQLPPDEMEL